MRRVNFISTAFIVLFAFGCDSNNKGKNQTPVQASQQVLIEVEKWGPQETPKGVKFNVQPNGLSAIWVDAKGISKDPKTYAIFGTNDIKEVAVSDKGITFSVSDEFISKAGSYEVAIIQGDTNKKIVVGNFIVK